MPTPPPESSLQGPSGFDIVKHYDNLLRTDSDITKPIAAIESLIALLSASPPSTISETLALIESSTTILRNSVPNSTALSAGTNLFQHYIISTLKSGSTGSTSRNKRSADSSSSDDFGAIRTHLLANSKMFVHRAKESRGSIARIARRFVQDGSTVLTCGYSRVVAAVLEAAANDGVAFKIIYVQSLERSSQRCKAQELVTKLRKMDVPVATAPFAALAPAVSRATFCMVGAESVVENGGVISTLGTQQMGLLAQIMDKPLYVVAESHKFVRIFPLDAEDLRLVSDSLDFRVDRTTHDEEDREQVEALGSNRLDFTPPELITLLVTEAGVHTPSAVSEELVKIFY